MRQPPRQPRRLSAPDGGSAAPWWQWWPWKGDGACKEQIVADVGPAGYWDDDVRDPSANRHRGLKMVTMNVTSWNSCRNYLRIVCDADLVFIQETKKHKEAAREVAAALYKQGWRAAFAPSHIKENDVYPQDGIPGLGGGLWGALTTDTDVRRALSFLTGMAQYSQRRLRRPSGHNHHLTSEHGHLPKAIRKGTDSME